MSVAQAGSKSASRATTQARGSACDAAVCSIVWSETDKCSYRLVTLILTGQFGGYQCPRKSAKKKGTDLIAGGSESSNGQRTSSEFQEV